MQDVAGIKDQAAAIAAAAFAGPFTPAHLSHELAAHLAGQRCSSLRALVCRMWQASRTRQQRLRQQPSQAPLQRQKPQRPPKRRARPRCCTQLIHACTSAHTCILALRPCLRLVWPVSIICCAVVASPARHKLAATACWLIVKCCPAQEPKVKLPKEPASAAAAAASVSPGKSPVKGGPDSARAKRIAAKQALVSLLLAACCAHCWTAPCLLVGQKALQPACHLARAPLIARAPSALQPSRLWCTWLATLDCAVPLACGCCTSAEHVLGGRDCSCSSCRPARGARTVQVPSASQPT